MVDTTEMGVAQNLESKRHVAFLLLVGLSLMSARITAACGAGLEMSQVTVCPARLQSRDICPVADGLGGVPQMAGIGGTADHRDKSLLSAVDEPFTERPRIQPFEMIALQVTECMIEIEAIVVAAPPGA